MNNVHVPVMLREVIEYLKPESGRNFIDGTLGGGGYTRELLKKVLPLGKILAIDLDQEAIGSFQKEIDERYLEKNIILVQSNFADLKNICHERGFNQISGVVLDLGLSSNQLQAGGRGFSFQDTGSLDMRFDTSLAEDGESRRAAASPLTAFEIINKYRVEELVKIFSNYGQEVLAKPISKTIHEIRQQTPISSPQELADIVTEVYARHFKTKSKVHPATKVFQALRIAVNRELENLELVLPQALDLLQPGGRLVVVSFHSLEDGMVKNFFRQESRDCLCPPESPVCQCGHQAKLKILTKKPLAPSAEEVINNPRARSAKMRVAEKI